MGGKKASALWRRDSYWENITVSMKKSGTEGKKPLVRNFEGGFQKSSLTIIIFDPIKKEQKILTKNKSTKNFNNLFFIP